MRAVCTQGLEALLAMKEDLEGKRSEATGAGLKDGVYRLVFYVMVSNYKIQNGFSSTKFDFWLTQIDVTYCILNLGIAIINKRFELMS
jgi:hypothetical protein